MNKISNMNKIRNILLSANKQIDPTIINFNQITNLVKYLYNSIEDNIEGDIVEFGCYVGESSKYLMKTLVETKSTKKLYVYDSFEGLPNLSKWEENTGWTPGTLKTSQDVLIKNFNQNNLPLPIIHKDWFKDIPNDKIPKKISFAFLDGDFYESIYDSLNRIYDRVSDGGFICFHDYQRNDLPGVRAAIEDVFREKEVDYTVVEVCEQLGVYQKIKNLPKNKDKTNSNSLTLVTGLWDIKRDSLGDGWNRSYNHYLDKIKQLLDVENNLIVFGNAKLKEFVFTHRNEENTFFIERDLDWFKNNNYFDLIQKIRTNPQWYSQVGWLEESTQAKLEYYNPLVMSKMFLLHDAKIMDPFDSEYMFWIDAGLTNTVHPGYFTHDKVFNNLPKYISKFSFVCFPYETTTEIHGFEYNKMVSFAGTDVNKVARGGFFGGPKETIKDLNGIYYNLLLSTLNEGYMGTEESIFSIMCYKHSDLINYFEIDGNGLFGKFFEDLKDDKLIIKSENTEIVQSTLDTSKVGLYVITFNSPKQFETLVKSMLDYDSNFISKTKKYLLDNSTDLTTTPRYVELCELYGFEHIKKDNIGISGGRQFIAEHFNETDLDIMVFSEDDMFFQSNKNDKCLNGFNRYSENLFNNCLNILRKENYDFLKINFTEFYGDNSTEWAWYNVPQEFRLKNWPEKPNLPVQGLDPNAPKTIFKNIKSMNGLPYADGEIYYCNWTQFVTKEGSKKMFIDTKFASPFESTLMSFMFQETKKGVINPGILLLTPIEHNRFDHYSAELRKEF